MKIIACACWAYVETILLHTEHTRNRFYCTLSIRGANFHACSTSGKMITVFTCTSIFSIRGTNFIVHWAYADKFHRWLSIRGMDFIAGWAYAEMFKSWIPWPNWQRFSKILCYRPSGPSGFGFCKKNFKKNVMLV